MLRELDFETAVIVYELATRLHSATGGEDKVAHDVLSVIDANADKLPYVGPHPSVYVLMTPEERDIFAKEVAIGLKLAATQPIPELEYEGAETAKIGS